MEPSNQLCRSTTYLRLGGDQPPEVGMLSIIWLKKVEVRVCSLLDSQNKLSLTTSLLNKLCSLQNDLQATLSQRSVQNRDTAREASASDDSAPCACARCLVNDLALTLGQQKMAQMPHVEQHSPALTPTQKELRVGLLQPLVYRTHREWPHRRLNQTALLLVLHAKNGSKLPEERQDCSSVPQIPASVREASDSGSVCGSSSSGCRSL